MGGSDAIRGFERMFPGIGLEEREFENNILAEGRTAAERYRRIREAETSREIADNMNNGGSILIGTYDYDFEKGTETYTPADKKST